MAYTMVAVEDPGLRFDINESGLGVMACVLEDVGIDLQRKRRRPSWDEEAEAVVPERKLYGLGDVFGFLGSCVVALPDECEAMAERLKAYRGKTYRTIDAKGKIVRKKVTRDIAAWIATFAVFCEKAARADGFWVS